MALCIGEKSSSTNFFNFIKFQPRFPQLQHVAYFGLYLNFFHFNHLCLPFGNEIFHIEVFGVCFLIFFFSFFTLFLFLLEMLLLLNCLFLFFLLILFSWGWSEWKKVRRRLMSCSYVYLFSIKGWFISITAGRKTWGLIVACVACLITCWNHFLVWFQRSREEGIGHRPWSHNEIKYITLLM